VWSVGPNHEGDERGAHLASLGGLRIINIDWAWAQYVYNTTIHGYAT
jgi:hypothetical protein